MRRHEGSTYATVRAWLWTLFVLSVAGGTLRGGGAPSPLTAPPGPLPGDAHLTLADLRALAASVGFPNPELAAAVAMAESSGYPHAQGDPRGPFLATPNGVSHSFGLWQVNTPSHPEFDAAQLLDPTYNAHAAMLISKGGVDWTPWTTFRDGTYKQFMGASA